MCGVFATDEGSEVGESVRSLRDGSALDLDFLGGGAIAGTIFDAFACDTVQGGQPGFIDLSKIGVLRSQRGVTVVQEPLVSGPELAIAIVPRL